MKKLLFILFILFPAISHGNIFTEIKISDATLKYVTYKVGDTDYSINVAISESAMHLDELLLENNWITGINWVFFCPEDYQKCAWKNYTINERFVQWQDLSFYPETGERWVFAWKEDYTPFLFKTDYINQDKRTDIYEWMWNFPILLHEGKSNISYYDAIWLLDTKMKVSIPRHFICSNVDSNEIIFWESSDMSLEQLANILWEIWCFNALNLDAGLSSHYTYNGRSITKGKRKIIDWFIISPKNFSVIEVETRLDKVFDDVFWKYKTMPKIDSLRSLNRYKNLLAWARREIYNNNSKDLYNTEWIYIWYSIDIKSVKTQEHIYIINSFEKRISDLQKDILGWI